MYDSKLVSPGREAALLLLRSRQTPQVIRHSLAVAAVARQLAGRLNQAGLIMDIGLITAGGLLHDIAKGQQHHARQGGQLLKSWGYPLLAGVIESHMDLVFDGCSHLDEKAIVFFADKSIREDRIVNPGERFQMSLKKYAGQPEVLASIESRFQSWQKIGSEVRRLLESGANAGLVLPPYLRELSPGFIKFP